MINAEFYIYGYETIQSVDGFKCVVKLDVRTDDGFKFINHVLIELDEIKSFFESIEVTPFEFSLIPGKEGRCFIEKDYERYFVRGWINKEGEIKG